METCSAINLDWNVSKGLVGARDSSSRGWRATVGAASSFDSISAQISVRKDDSLAGKETDLFLILTGSGPVVAEAAILSNVPSFASGRCSRGEDADSSEDGGEEGSRMHVVEVGKVVMRLESCDEIRRL